MALYQTPVSGTQAILSYGVLRGLDRRLGYTIKGQSGGLMGLLVVYKAHLPLCDPEFDENSRSLENQLDFFSQDHEKLFSISQSRLETLDWRRTFLFSSRSTRLQGQNSCFRLKKWNFHLNFPIKENESTILKERFYENSPIKIAHFDKTMWVVVQTNGIPNPLAASPAFPKYLTKREKKRNF